MAHVRTQIRDAIVAILNGNTSAAQVQAGRIFDIPIEILRNGAHISVFTAEDNVDQGQDVVIQADGSIPQWRILSVAVDVRAVSTATKDWDTVLDDVCAEVESLLAGALTLGGLAKWLIYSSVTKEASTEAELPLGVAQMVFSAEYRVDQRDPETPME